jgi:CBS domain-containing protein
VVVEAAGALAGILTESDFVRFVVEQAPAGRTKRSDPEAGGR